MRLTAAPLLFLAAILAFARGGAVPPDPRTPEVVADSLFDASAFDTLLAFSSRMMAVARASGDSARLGRMTFHRGRARLLLRDPGGAADFDRALSLAVASRDTTGWMAALGLQGVVASMAGRYDGAIVLNEERLRLALLAHHRRSEAWARLHLAYCSMQLQRYARARTEYDLAARAFHDVDRPHEELAALVGMGMVAVRSGAYEEASRAYRRALVRARELGDVSQEADVINNLAEIEYEHGELDVAARRYRQAFDLKRNTRFPDLALVASNVVELDVLIGQYAAAESVLVDALSFCEESGYTEVEAKLLHDLGELRLAQGRSGGAAAAFRRAVAQRDASVQHHTESVTGLALTLAARDSVLAAAALLDAELADIDGAPPSMWRANAFVEWSRCLRGTGAISRANRAAHFAWEDALARSDTTRALLAAVEISECLARADDRAGAHEWFARALSMFNAVGTRSREYRWREVNRLSLVPPLVAASRIVLEWPRDVAPRVRERALFDALQVFRARTLLERVSDPRRLGGPAGGLYVPVSLDEIQRETLEPGDCLLDFTITGDEVWAFAVTSDSLRLTRIDCAATDLKRRARAYARLVASPPASRGAPDPTSDGARFLGDALLAGAADLVHSARRVTIVTDGWLAAVPFETLVCPGEDALLGDDRNVVRAPAVALLRRARERGADPAHPARVLALAPASNELRFARREVDRIESRYANVTRFDGNGPDALLAAMHNRDVIHIASHIRVDGERPWHSGIDIGGGVGQSLRASRVAAEILDPQLVVLSGCASALGRATHGEGVLGVSSAFLASGSRAVVASLWEVDDRTTADLMQEFYRGLGAGKPAGEALRLARRVIRVRHPHPFFWAGFVVIGDGEVEPGIAPRRGRGSPLILAALSGLAVVVIAGWGARRRRARMNS